MTTMTLVVSDNSPLNLLVRIGCEGILPSLFNRVVIPPEVVSEMTHPKAPAEVRAFIVSPPTWLAVQAPVTRLPLPHLDSGEAAAISLAAELGAALLIDETDGRHEAQTRGLIVIGAVGVLERAADAGFMVDLAEAHNRVRGLNFHVAESILRASLARHLAHVASSQGSP